MALELDPLHPLGTGLLQCIVAFGPNGGLWDYAQGNHPLVSPQAPPVVDYGGYKAWEYTGAQEILLDPEPMRAFGHPPKGYAVMFRTTPFTTHSTIFWGGLDSNGWGELLVMGRVINAGILSMYMNPFVANIWLNVWAEGTNDGRIRLFIGHSTTTGGHYGSGQAAVGCSPIPPDDWDSVGGQFYSLNDLWTARPDIHATRRIGLAVTNGTDMPTTGHIFGVWVWDRTLTWEDWQSMINEPFGMFIETGGPPPAAPAVPINVAVMA